jgi:hypothetical protein
MSTYTVPDFGPSDLLSSAKEGERRVKVAIDPELARKIDLSIDVFGQTNTAEYTPIVGQKPLPGLSFLRDKLVGGDAQFSVVGGEIKIDGALGLRSLYTKDYGLYIPGLLGLAGVRARMATPTVGTYRYGYGNGDGNRVGLEVVNGVYRTFIESGGVRWYQKERSEWLDPLDGTGPSGINADLNGATLRIVLGWYGGISILFSVIIADRINGDKKIIFDSSGSRVGAVTLEQPDLPIFAEASGGSLYVGGRQYGVYGRYRPQFRVTSNRAVTKTVGVTLIPLVSMRVKSDTKWLSVPVSIDGESVLSNVATEYAFIIGGTLTGAVFGNISGIDPNETALEVDTAATAISGGYRAAGGLVTGSVGNRAGAPASALPDITVPAGTVVTLAAVALSGSGDVTAIMRMRELF